MRTTSARLDPARRLRLPHRATLLRLAAAAALLLVAAATLYSGDRAPEAASAPPPATGSPEPGGRLPIPSGAVGVPVTLADPAGLALLHPGDRVDLFAVAAAGGEPARLAGGSPVLAVDRDAAALLLALTPAQGEAVVTLPAGTAFAVLARG